MVQILAAFVLIMIIPFMFRDFRRSLARMYLIKDLVPSIEEMDGLGERTGTRYCWFEIPATNLRLIAEISIEKYEAIKEGSQKASVVIRQIPFLRPKITHVQWEGEAGYESADRGNSAVYAMTLYLLAGFGFMAWSFEFAGLSAQIALYLSAVLLAMSGYTAMVCQSEKFTRAELKIAPVRMLGIPIGKGRIGFFVGALLCFAATAFFFSYVSILTLILGFNLAVTFGCMLYLAIKA